MKKKNNAWNTYLTYQLLISWKSLAWSIMCSLLNFLWFNLYILDWKIFQTEWCKFYLVLLKISREIARAYTSTRQIILPERKVVHWKKKSICFFTKKKKKKRKSNKTYSPTSIIESNHFQLFTYSFLKSFLCIFKKVNFKPFQEHYLYF